MRKKDKKDIIVLSESEHVLMRCEMYVGSVTLTEEKIPVIENRQLIEKNKLISVGMYKCFDEIFDNSFDELKRQFAKGSLDGKITVELNTKDNSITITDNGGGFNNPDSIHETTGLTNVETALSQLRAGSNFTNDDIDENLIGTNGVGASLVNILSDEFSVETCDGYTRYKHEWEKFETVSSEVTHSRMSGTSIRFVLRQEIFPKLKWDQEILKSKLILKTYLKNNSSLENINIEFFINDIEQELNVDFLPQERILYEKTLPRMSLKVIAFKNYANSCSISFVNDSMCQGIHQKIIIDEINQKLFEFDKAHNFYDTIVILNLAPKYVKFGDQNKTKFIGNRTDLQNIIQFEFGPKLIAKYRNSDFYNETLSEIELTLAKNELKKINKTKRQIKTKISDKYFPSDTQDTIFMVEGLSASGSILQERDPKTQAVYALKGKVKNTRHIGDLSSNKEIMDLIAILDLDLETKGNKCKFNKIVIATDADSDGSHIASLLINFFYNWFPKIIENKKLFMLETPLIRAENKKETEYYYSHEEFVEASKTTTLKDKKYLKGLGSLNAKDWIYVFSNLKLKRIYADVNATKIIDIAFGTNANKRKRWLEK